MKNAIVFATTNADKVREAAGILQMKIIPSGLDVPEIQSLDPQKVALAKAAAYFKALKRPLLVEDSSLVFTALPGLPGPYINDFFQSLGNTGLIRLLNGARRRAAVATTTLVYCDSRGRPHLFQGAIRGSISLRPLGTNGFGWDPIFIPRGHTRTFAQMTAAEKNSLSMRARALRKLKAWFETGH